MFNKKWYMSKTVQGAGFALAVAIVSAMFGEMNMFSQALIAVGTSFGIYGRVKSDGKLVL